MTSYEKDVHQLAADFLREVQFGQRVRKIREVEQSHRIEVDAPEDLVLVRPGRVVTYFAGFKSEKALFAHDAKLAKVMPSHEAETVKMLLAEHGIEVTTMPAPTLGKASW
jgi:hypothetical protein